MIVLSLLLHLADSDTQLNEEQVQDFAFTNSLDGTETHISVTYNDGTGNIDFVVTDDWWDTLTDMVLTENYIYVGDASNDPVGVAMSNDCTIASNGAITCDHDALDNFVANEHLDWTASVGTIHTDNYIEGHGDGANCAAGEIPLGVDAAGAVQSCYEPSEADITDLVHLATAITDGLIIEADLNADEEPTDNDILTFDTTGDNFSWQTPTELGLLYSGGTLTDTQICVADGTSGAIDCNIAQSFYVEDGCTDCLNDTEIEDIYLHDGASDVMTGTLTADGLTLGANELITLGAQTLTHDGTDFVFNDTIAVSNDSISPAEIDENGDFTWTGTTHDFSGVTNLKIPAVADAASEIAIDTTNDDQFIYYGDEANVLTGFYEKCFVLENASTTDDNIAFWFPHRAITITDVYCMSSAGTTQMTISDGTNALELIACDTDGQADDGSITNGAFTANERMEFDIGTVGEATNILTVCITYTITAD